MTGPLKPTQPMTLPVMNATAERWVQQRGRVLAVEGGTAEVAVDKSSACGGCAATAGCGVKALIDLQKRHADAPVRVTMHPNALHREAARQVALAEGDAVSVAMPGRDFVQAACLAFLLPPLALVLALASSTALALPVLATCLLTLVAFAAAFYPLRCAERRGVLAQGLRIDRDATPEQGG